MTTSRFITLFSFLILSTLHASSALASQSSQNISNDIPWGYLFLAIICFRFSFHRSSKSKDRRARRKKFKQQKTSMLALSRSLSDRADSLIRSLTNARTASSSSALLRDLQAFHASVTQFFIHVNKADFKTCGAMNYDEVTLFSEKDLKSIHFQQWDTYAQRFEKQLQDLEQRFHLDQEAFSEQAILSTVVEESTPSSSLRRFKTLSRSHVSSVAA